MDSAVVFVKLSYDTYAECLRCPYIKKPYDIADLYKLETSVPAAFSVIGGSYADLEREVRTACRRWIRIARVLKRIPEDIAWIFEQPSMDDQENASEAGSLWDRGGEQLRGGHNYAEEADE